MHELGKWLQGINRYDQQEQKEYMLAESNGLDWLTTKAWLPSYIGTLQKKIIVMLYN